ncbi:hypothetical protein [Bacillus cereus group sp. MYBK87-2]|uniref:hypothetical protein n=1 Tax=unclassified Bacillus cereus group TaxID=2750818 RepID=UPI003F79F9CE
MAETLVQLQIVDANTNEQYRLISCTPSEASLWINCSRFLIYGREVEYVYAHTYYLEGQGTPPTRDRIQLQVVPAIPMDIE